LADTAATSTEGRKPTSILAGPRVNPTFRTALEVLASVARQGQRPDSPFFNPPDEWIVRQMRVFQDQPRQEQERLLRDWEQANREAEAANKEGKAAARSGPDTALRLDTGGYAFYSQLGVARRPDLTQYFVEGFERNRDAIAFSEENQALFAEVLPYITRYMGEHLAKGDAIIQCDRQIGDVPGHALHARLLLFGARYMQIPYFWRQLTFDLPPEERAKPPHILEVSIPGWLDDLGLPEDLKARIRASGLTKLVFKAPTKGLSLHLGFDYVGEHKMGPLSIGMFLVKESGGLAVQAALSVARVNTLQGDLRHTAMVTLGPSLHGKSTLTIMLELANSQFARMLHLAPDPREGVYPMNDDIVLLQPLRAYGESNRSRTIRITHAIDGTENSFYAVPYGLTREDDPITYDVVRGAPGHPNPQETLENVPCDPRTGTPNFMSNPTRNMRMALNRRALIKRKGVQHIIEAITNGRESDSVHVPMPDIDQVFWQAVMRLNTVIPPLRRLSLQQYIRVLMYGEAVQMGAAVGAIGRPYVEYFSDPFIIGLEDQNANLLFNILQQMELGGMALHYYVFNTGGVGADFNDAAAGAKYRKIPRELTLMLQEALLRGAVKFEYDPVLRSDVAVAVTNAHGDEVLDLRREWLPREIYGKEEYGKRIVELSRRRYYGRDITDKAGILRYTKVSNAILDVEDIPAPTDERQLATLLSFFWSADQTYPTLAELAEHIHEGRRPAPELVAALRQKFQAGERFGLTLGSDARRHLGVVNLVEGA
jgi:hypothetical protein